MNTPVAQFFLVCRHWDIRPCLARPSFIFSVLADPRTRRVIFSPSEVNGVNGSAKDEACPTTLDRANKFIIQLIYTCLLGRCFHGQKQNMRSHSDYSTVQLFAIHFAKVMFGKVIF